MSRAFLKIFSANGKSFPFSATQALEEMEGEGNEKEAFKDKEDKED